MEKIKIFTDGSSRGNPGPGGWGAIVIYPNSAGEMLVDELGGGDLKTTNNKMELMAAIKALELFKDGQFTVCADSSYVINGITKWVHGWQKNNWRTGAKQPVLNQDLWQKLVDASAGKKIIWQYVAGHAGIPANERCDEIATSFADGQPADLYKGSMSGYSIDTNNFSGHLIGEKKVSYLSMVDGVIEVHQTWDECKKRVTGKSGAKFKKVLNKSQEEKVIAEWKTL